MGSVFTCKLNPCCGDRRNCDPPRQYYGETEEETSGRSPFRKAEPRTDPGEAPPVAPTGTVVAFGEGRLVVDTGTYQGRPAVFIAPASNPGDVGASAAREGHDLHSLQPGEIVLTFPTPEQAKAVEDSLFTGAERIAP